MKLSVRAEAFAIRGDFVIARERRTVAKVVAVTIDADGHTGRGEATPYPRYGESVEGVVAAIEAMAGPIADGMDRTALQEAMPRGAARSAIDCALFDLEAKRTGVSVAERLGLSLRPLTTAYTLSIGEPEAMADAAREAGRPLLKVKLGRPEGDDARIAAVRAAVPDATLLVDANEGWRDANLLKNLAACQEARVALVEQPLPAGRDGVLATISHPVPICADESAHGLDDLAALKGRYDAINVKLDKAGGLTEALALVEAARREGFSVMLGCMLASSLSMAPAFHAAQSADYVDLDAPLLLAEDRDNPIAYEGATMLPPSPALWG